MWEEDSLGDSTKLAGEQWGNAIHRATRSGVGIGIGIGIAKVAVAVAQNSACIWF